MRTALFALLLGACHPAPPGPVRAADFPDDMPSCIGDDDCVITTFVSCCGCPGPERIVSRVEDSERPGCADVVCDPKPACKAPPASRWKRAACDRGRCVGKR